MKGQRIHDSVFLEFNSEPDTGCALLPGGIHWYKWSIQANGMLEIGASIVSAQNYISGLKQVTQGNFATLDDTLQAIEKFMSTGKSLQFEYYTCHIVSII